MPLGDIIISNGFHKFHLGFAAAQLAARKRLRCLLTGAYPSVRLKSRITGIGLNRYPAMQRLLDREVDVPERLIRSYWSSEILQMAGATARSGRLNSMSHAISCYAMRWYANLATNTMPHLTDGSTIYHYRAGFGGESVKLAKEKGLITICDHSIAHPALVESLSYRMQDRMQNNRSEISQFWKIVQRDIEAADHVLVNSDFVRHTFQLAGSKVDNVHVIYLGIDDEFAKAVPAERIYDIKRTAANETPHILFAGGFGERKGAREVIAALREICGIDWTFSIAGNVEREIVHEFNEFREFLGSSRVKVLGWLPRRELAQVMAGADVFLFPSRAEGSARVLFEALSCGCFVITTDNSGSIVVDGQHGVIVPPYDAAAITKALSTTLTNLPLARRAGLENAQLVRNEYTEERYGQKLEEFYDALLSSA